MWFLLSQGLAACVVMNIFMPLYLSLILIIVINISFVTKAIIIIIIKVIIIYTTSISHITQSTEDASIKLMLI